MERSPGGLVKKNCSKEGGFMWQLNLYRRVTTLWSNRATRKTYDELDITEGRKDCEEGNGFDRFTILWNHK